MKLLNYTVDNSLLEIDAIKDLKGNLRIATWIMLCQVLHMWKHSKDHRCAFRKNSMAKDLGIKNSFFTQASKILLEHKLIECIKPYDRRTQSPAIYVGGIGYTSSGHKLYLWQDKAIPPGGKVKEFQKNSKQKKEDLSSSSSLNEKITIPTRQRHLRNL